MFGENNNSLFIVIGIVVAILVVAILVIILEVLVFSKNRMKKKYQALDNEYHYLNTLLISQDSQYVQRLESMARTNLLYVDLHQKYLEMYQELRTGLDLEVDKFIQDLKGRVDEKDTHGFKKVMNAGLPFYNKYKESVTTLNAELVETIKPEEDCRQSSLLLKDKYREVKSLYLENKDKVVPYDEKIDIIFKNVDHKLDDFDKFVASADFDEAKSLLPILGKVLNQVSNILNCLPQYLEEVNDIIPKEMGNIIDRYRELCDDKLPLTHLHLEEEYERIKQDLIATRSGFEELKVKDVDKVIENSHSLLASLSVGMDKEVKARDEFKIVSPLIMSAYQNLERNIVKLNNSVPNYRKYYKIDDEHEKLLNKIAIDLDMLSKAKRRIDYYTSGVEKTYYSDLLNKDNDLKNGIEQLSNTVINYKNYLDSLKEHVDSATALIGTKYIQLKKAVALLRELNNDEILNNNNDDIEDSYNSIDKIYSILKETPIDVHLLDETVDHLNDVSGRLFKNVDDLASFRELASDNILLINRDRMKFNDVNNQLSQVENLYFNGEYKSSYEMSETILKKLEDKDKVVR